VADTNEGTGVTTVTNHRTYNSFGTQISETNAAVDFLFGEAGKMLDEYTGMNNHINRWLRGGQWLSEDPIVFEGGDPNLRRDVHNNPVNSTDPAGLEEKPRQLKPAPKSNGEPIGPDGFRYTKRYGPRAKVTQAMLDGVKAKGYSWKTLEIRVFMTPKCGEDWFETLRLAQEFYAHFGILIEWDVWLIDSNPLTDDHIDDIDIDASEAELKRGHGGRVPDIDWIKANFPDVPTLFLVEDFDFPWGSKESATGVTNGKISIVRSHWPWMGEQGISVAHEIGDMCGYYKYDLFGVMARAFESSLDIEIQNDSTIEWIREAPILKGTNVPAAQPPPLPWWRRFHWPKPPQPGEPQFFIMPPL
jgi:RHS repeat-associated protein